MFDIGGTNKMFIIEYYSFRALHQQYFSVGGIYPYMYNLLRLYIFVSQTVLIVL